MLRRLGALLHRRVLTPLRSASSSSTPGTTIPMPAEVSSINSPIHSITGRIREKVGAGVAKSGEELAVKFWLTAAALDQFLRASQNSSFVGVDEVHTISVSQLAANDPLEDRFAVVREPNSNRVIVLVADGHGGSHCAQELVDQLVHRVFDAWSKHRQLQPSSASVEPDVAGMQNMLQKTFLEFDDELLQRLLDPQASVGAKRAALAGSCAVMACIDGPNVYVANTGDCRAVLVKKAGKEFEAVDLTVDQTLENPAERKRILSEHPGELEEVLTARDRILGGLQPARAFGDAKYKVSIDMHKQVLSRIIGSKSMRPGYATPPYVTAKPVVSHHRIEPGADVCMVLATDGLWDKLESSQVASLLGVHAQTLPVSEANFQEDDRESVDMGPNSGFVMADSNPATHLIRNALGGGSHAALCKQLGTIPPHTRKIRDDITCVVVHFTPPADKAKL